MNTSPLDPSIWSWLRGLPAPTINELIDTYLATTPPLLDELQLAIALEDRGRLKQRAHKLIGSSGALGGRVLAALCQECEARAQTATQPELRAWFRQVTLAYGQVAVALAGERTHEREVGAT